MSLQSVNASGYIVRSTSYDPASNLATEEALFESKVTRGAILLFLYTNAPCVVVGKNQNPWLECNLAAMEKDQIPLHRRISGGGAVYHDSGNLNFSFMMPRSLYSECWPYDLISQTLKDFGIDSTRSGKSGMETGGLKFSGQAYCYRRDRVLHHGTLLVDSDLSRLGEYLEAKSVEIETHAIRSTRAQVVNLSALNETLTVDTLGQGIEQQFTACTTHLENQELLSIDPDEVERYNSWAWQYGRTPRFSYKGLEVIKGQINDEAFSL